MAVEEHPLPVRCLADGDAADGPTATDTHDAAAEAFAALGCMGRGTPSDLALFASIKALRSIRLAPHDPARALELRRGAESLFDAVESSGDVHALGVVAFALNELATAADDAATVRLERIIGNLSTKDALAFRAAVERTQKKNSKRSD